MQHNIYDDKISVKFTFMIDTYLAFKGQLQGVFCEL